MTDEEAQCYIDRFPDIAADALKDPTAKEKTAAEKLDDLILV